MNGQGSSTVASRNRSSSVNVNNNATSSLINNGSNTNYETLTRNPSSADIARPATPVRYRALRRRYTTSYRLPKHSRPPLLLTLFRNPVRIIPIVLVIAAVVVFIYTFPRQFAPPGADPGLDPHRPILFKKSSFDWAAVKHRFPVPEGGLKKIPAGPARDIRRVQHGFGPTYASDPSTESRKTAVRKAARRSWEAYKEKAWGRDVLCPISGTGKDDHAGWALSLVEALDTLWIMELRSEFHEAAALAAELDFGRSPASGLWTVDLATRYLGGYLGAYELSGVNPLLLKAKEVGDMVYLAFDTKHHMPVDWFGLTGAKTGRLAPGQKTEIKLMALVLEMTRLGQITGNDRYYDASDRVMEFLASTQMETRLPGLWPEQLNLKAGEVGTDNVFSISHSSAGLYQVLPTMYLLTGGLEEKYMGMYRQAVSTLQNELLWRPRLPGNDDIVFPGTLYAHRDRTDLVPQTTSTGCVLASVLAVGGKIFDLPSHVDLASRLLESCIWAREQFPAHLIPQTFNMLKCPSLSGCEWDNREWLDARRDGRLKEGFTHVPDRRYLMGPETIESLFVLWRVTGKKELRDLAFAIFEKVTQETTSRYGYAGVEDVLGTRGERGRGMIDLTDSHWLGATLKYFYLMYAHPNYLDLDDWVFTTAGHPLKRPVNGLHTKN